LVLAPPRQAGAPDITELIIGGPLARRRLPEEIRPARWFGFHDNPFWPPPCLPGGASPNRDLPDPSAIFSGQPSPPPRGFTFPPWARPGPLT